MHRLITVFLLAVGIQLSTSQAPGESCGEGVGKWIGWFDVDSNMGDGDFETIDNIRRVFGEDFCPNPLGFYTDAGDDVTYFKDDTYGVFCYNLANNGSCPNLRVLVCCSGDISINTELSYEGYSCLTEKHLAVSGTHDDDDDIPCINPCDESGYTQIFTNETNCDAVPYCVWSGTTCMGKKFSSTPIIGSSPATGRLFGLPGGGYGGGAGGGGGGGIGGGAPQVLCWPPGGGGPIPYPTPPPKFPYNCNIQAQGNTLALIQPPIQIPYCYRVPCSSSDPTLDLDIRRCLSYPGCFFDLELHNLRSTGGRGVMPNVPVCHLVIRHRNFAPAVTQALAAAVPPVQWNSIYTKCFIDQNPHIFYDHYCNGISIFNYYNRKTMRQGWPGITEKECRYIGGCYSHNECLTPPHYSQIGLRSAPVDPYRSPGEPKGRDIFGQPFCLPFNINSSPSGVLDAYHQCRLAGCTVDPFVDWEKIRGYLCRIALDTTIVPVNIRRKFWDKVLNGQAGAHNYYQVIQQLIEQERSCPNLFGGLSILNQYQPLPHCTNVFDLLGAGLPHQGATQPPPYNPATQNPFLNLINQFNLELGTTAPPSSGSSQGGDGTGRFFPYPTQPQPGYPPQQFFPPPQQFYPPPQQLVCPYQLYSYGPVQLTGRLDGCCERNYCFLPRALARSAGAGEAEYHSTWAEWSDCSASCGDGQQKRHRQCVQPDHRKGQAGCDDAELTETKFCNKGDCPYWGPMGEWSECTASCGGGTQTRQQRCLPAGKTCGGTPLTENRDCNTCACPVWKVIQNWSPCSVTKGCGYSTLVRTCQGNCPDGCTASEVTITEQKPCKVHCEVTKTPQGTCAWVGAFGFGQRYTQTCPCTPNVPGCKMCGDFQANVLERCNPWAGK